VGRTGRGFLLVSFFVCLGLLSEVRQILGAVIDALVIMK
jgi:hypothetical protein